MGLSQPKQFEMLHGKTVLEHSVDTFEKHPKIDGIFVVVHEDFLENTKRLLHVRNRPKIVGVIAGGAERMDSSRNAILAVSTVVSRASTTGTISATSTISATGTVTEALEVTDCNLLIHDAARPFITEKIITDTVDALKTRTAVSVAIPATDTVYICNNNEIQSSPKRETVYLAQTPQGGRLSVLKRAFALTLREPQRPAQNDLSVAEALEATDDACVILHHLPDEKIHIVLGDVANRKITFQSDLL